MNSIKQPCSYLISLAYSLAWILALPILPLFSSMRPGFWQRIFPRTGKQQLDIWIQAASAGETALVQEIIQNWPQFRPVTLLASSNTLQGMQVLKDIKPPRHIRLQTAFFPLDLPWIMNRTLCQLRPRLLVLLETELWPGLLQACSRQSVKAIVLNARMSTQSLARYLFLFHSAGLGAAPQKILAQSNQDMQRFQLLFPACSIEYTPNLKFERGLTASFLPYVQNPLSVYFKPNSALIVLGSVRKQEEEALLRVLCRLLQEKPRCIPSVVPRHMQRLPAWKRLLQDAGLPWILRSNLQENPAPGQIILWDVFGELQQLYALARAVFVGGSLAPLGGQNFLEPLAQGVIPVIGPHWHNFSWVGQEIIRSGLVQQVDTEQDLVYCLLTSLKQSRSRENAWKEFRSYVESRQGGLQKSIQTLLQDL